MFSALSLIEREKGKGKGKETRNGVEGGKEKEEEEEEGKKCRGRSMVLDKGEEGGREGQG